MRRIVDTLLIDHETVHAPRRSNDRLLLGLRGSLNEHELDRLRQRSIETRRAPGVHRKSMPIELRFFSY